MKKILPVVIGVVVGFAIIFIGDSVTHRLYAPPVDLKFMDKIVLDAYLSSIPTYIFVIMLLFWMLSSFLGGMVAARLNRADWKKKSLITGSILMAATILNLISMPSHPLWMVVSSLLLYIPVAFVGGWLVKPKDTTVS